MIFSLWIFLAPLWNISWSYMYGLILWLLILFHWFMCLFLCLYHVAVITIAYNIAWNQKCYVCRLLWLLGVSFSFIYILKLLFFFFTILDRNISNNVSLLKISLLLNLKIFLYSCNLLFYIALFIFLIFSTFKFLWEIISSTIQKQCECF